MHGGNEYFPYLRQGLRNLCQYYIDLGVEAVICHHPHVPGAYEYYQGKPIVYSLGNFVFDTAKPPRDWELGYMAQLSFDQESKQFASLELIPYKQSVELGGVQLLGAQEKEVFLMRIEIYRKNLEGNQAWLDEWQAFVEKQTDSYIMRNFFSIYIPRFGFFSEKYPNCEVIL